MCRGVSCFGVSCEFVLSAAHVFHVRGGSSFISFQNQTCAFILTSRVCLVVFRSL